MAVGDGHGAQFRALHLKAGEEILAEETGSLEAEGKAPGGSGVALVTTHRVAFYRKRLMGGYLLKTIPLEAIVTIDHRRGLAKATVLLHSAHDRMALGFRGEGATRFHSAIEAARDIARGSLSRTASAATSLTDLRRLRDQALVTDQEYDAKRAEILARF